MAKLRLANAVKRFDDVEVIHGVDLDIEHGSFVVFVGPSGCGKSTLLRMIAGLEEITEGELFIDDQLITDMPPAQRGIAMVFQSYALYPHMTVFQNLAFGLETAGVDKATIRQRVQIAAGILRIEELLERRPKALSGGQRQRVAIGRAIVREPRLFLFDEPLSNLDAELRVQMRVELARLHKRLGATMIYVTHDQTEAMTMADRIVVLRAGKVEQIGTPLELYNTPANRFVAGFIGSPKMNFFDGRVGEAGAAGIAIDVPGLAPLRFGGNGGALQAGDRVTVGVRPEHLSLGGGGDVNVTAQVALIEQLGDETFIYATLPAGDTLVVRAPGQNAVQANQSLSIGLSLDACHVFDAGEQRWHAVPASAPASGAAAAPSSVRHPLQQESAP
jgi:ABC-type sugar transport system ATPase subunit